MKIYKWKVLMDRSSIQVKIRYMKIGLIIADFKRFGGEVYADDLFENPEINFSIDAGSANTQDIEINEKIYSKRFLSTDEFPQILFSAHNGCIASPGGIRELTGELSLKDVTRPMTMVVNYTDMRKVITGYDAVFNLFGIISIKDFRPAFTSTDNLDDQLSLNITIHLQRVSKI